MAFTPIRPSYAPADAIWRGPNNPGAAYKGIGGGWWAPIAPAKPPAAPKPPAPATFAAPPAPKQTPTGGAGLTVAPGVRPTQAPGPFQAAPKPAAPAPPKPTVNPGGPIIRAPAPKAPRPTVAKPPAPKPAPAPAPALPTAQAPGPFNIGLVPADEQAKQAAADTYGTDAGTALDAVQRAAMAYGDPSIMAGWNLGTTVDPNSALAQSALKAQQDQLTATDARERAGTLFSSLALQDRTNIMTAQQQAQAAGYSTYQDALANFNLAMTRAQNARDVAIAAANEDERQTALNQLPTAADTAAGGFTGGTTNITSKVPVGLQKTAKAGKAATLKPPKVPKGKAKLPSVGKGGKVAIPKGKVSPVKKAPKVGSRSSKGKAVVPPALLRASQK